VSLNAEIAPEPEKPSAPESHDKKEAHSHPEKPVPEEDPESDIDLDMTGVVGEKILLPFFGVSQYYFFT
jgi:hypothetical protein